MRQALRLLLHPDKSTLLAGSGSQDLRCWPQTERHGVSAPGQSLLRALEWSNGSKGRELGFF